jgi:hypothetical protein
MTLRVISPPPIDALQKALPSTIKSAAVPGKLVERNTLLLAAFSERPVVIELIQR